MDDIFVYKHRPARGVIWLTAAAALALGAAVYWLGLTDLLTVFVLFAALALAWILRPRPVYGIKLDGTHLTLGAWRKPRPIPLDSIAYLQAKDISDEITYVIVYRDEEAEEEGIFALDLPDEETLVEVMAERGIPVRARL